MTDEELKKFLFSLRRNLVDILESLDHEWLKDANYYVGRMMERVCFWIEKLEVHEED